jgi:FHA domain
VSKFVLLLADGTTLDVPLGKERMTIGRRADNDVCLPFPAVSGEHASVVTILADSFLEDLGSTNGTLVNGKPIVKHFLRDRDRIDVGRQLMVFMSDDNARVEPLPVEITTNRLLGLEARVDAAPAMPKSGVPAAARLRNRIETPPLSAFSDLLDQELGEVPAEIANRRSGTPARPPATERSPLSTRHESDRRLAAWAAEWVAPAETSVAGAIDTSEGPLHPEAATAMAGATAATGEAVPAKSELPEPTVKVLSGPSLGREVPFNGKELTVGRVGVQVVVVRRVGDGFRLVPVEGAQPPSVNGAPVAPEGMVLNPGDTFEVAGIRLELSRTS